MKPADRQKMCSNCDGRIPYEASQCPYCFAQQPVDSSSSKTFTSPSDPLAALYPPPYSTESSPKINTMTAAAPSEERTQAESIPFWAILMLTLGANLLTLGLLQFFFSDHGVLRLEMNASYWFLMVLVGAPLIYLGLKKLSSPS